MTVEDTWQCFVLWFSHYSAWGHYRCILCKRYTMS